MLESLSLGVLGAIFDALPVEMTFIDEDDTVRYYNKGDNRIFPRPPGVIGRKVQNCHPRKSVHVVNRILEEFRAGRKDGAEFWIDLNDRKIYIRYLPVRDASDKYLGCIEVTQDITDIKGIEGESRLLDWQ